MTELEHYISSYFGVVKDDLSKINSYFHVTTTQKGDFFLKAGHISDRLSFQRSGLLRVFRSAGEKEVTQWISTNGYFVTDLAGIHFHKPSRYHIQALTDCEFYTISRSDYYQLGQVIPKWHELEKLFIAHCFNLMEERVFTLLSMSAEERFMLLFQDQKELFNQVPLQYLASMMGMTPETLSRLRKKHSGAL